MRHRTPSGFLFFFFVCGCSASAPSNESPSCGQPVDPKNVAVADAEKLYTNQGLDAVKEYTVEQAGQFELISTSTFRSGTFPYIANEPRWIHAQAAAASKGWDVLILVDSKMLRKAGNSRPALYLYVLMGQRSPKD